jgi:hypothetical protein
MAVKSNCYSSRRSTVTELRNASPARIKADVLCCVNGLSSKGSLTFDAAKTSPSL